MQRQSRRNQSCAFKKSIITIFGKISCPEYYYCIDELHRFISIQKVGTLFEKNYEIQAREIYETQYQYHLKDLKRQMNSILGHRKNSPIIMLNSERYFSNIKELMTFLIKSLGLENSIVLSDYELKDFHKYFDTYVKVANLNMKNHFTETPQFSYAFLEITLNSKNLTQIPPSKQHFKLLIKLFKQVTPKTCQNFLSICKGTQVVTKEKTQQTLTYKGNRFSRFQKNYFLQAGDIDGQGGHSIYGKYFEDEIKTISHDQPGMVGMTNLGRSHTNSSQFYITLNKIPHFDKKYIVFGQVIYGMSHLRWLNKLQSRNDVVPAIEMVISDCGQFQYVQEYFSDDLQKLSDNVFEEISLKTFSSVKSNLNDLGFLEKQQSKKQASQEEDETSKSEANQQIFDLEKLDVSEYDLQQLNSRLSFKTNSKKRKSNQNIVSQKVDNILQEHQSSSNLLGNQQSSFMNNYVYQSLTPKAQLSDLQQFLPANGDF